MEVHEVYHHLLELPEQMLLNGDGDLTRGQCCPGIPQTSVVGPFRRRSHDIVADMKNTPI